jgi:hypothetical protein
MVAGKPGGKPPSIMKYSDHELHLPERWFTGTEWADGTAGKGAPSGNFSESSERGNASLTAFTG